MCFRFLYFTQDGQSPTDVGIFRIGLDGSGLTRIAADMDGLGDDPYGLVLDEDRKLGMLFNIMYILQIPLTAHNW